MNLSLLIGMVASALLALGLLMMKRRGEALPPARGLRAPRAILTWLCDPTWLGGLALETAGYALYLVALAGAPVSLVAVMMQGGIALFVLSAVIFLGERADPVEWIGMAAVLLAMLMLAVSLEWGAPEGRLDAGALGFVSVGAVAAAVAPAAGRRFVSTGAALAIASGLVFGLASLYAKALTATFIAGSGAAFWFCAVANPYFYLTILTNIAGLVMLQNAFHASRGIIAMPISSALSNIVPIAGGIAAFGEQLPAEPLAAALRVAAFVITIVGSAMLAYRRSA